MANRSQVALDELRVIEVIIDNADIMPLVAGHCRFPHLCPNWVKQSVHEVTIAPSEGKAMGGNHKLVLSTSQNYRLWLSMLGNAKLHSGAERNGRSGTGKTLL